MRTSNACAHVWALIGVTNNMCLHFWEMNYTYVMVIWAVTTNVCVQVVKNKYFVCTRLHTRLHISEYFMKYTAHFSSHMVFFKLFLNSKSTAPPHPSNSLLREKVNQCRVINFTKCVYVCVQVSSSSMLLTHRKRQTSVPTHERETHISIPTPIERNTYPSQSLTHTLAALFTDTPIYVLRVCQ